MSITVDIRAAARTVATTAGGRVGALLSRRARRGRSPVGIIERGGFPVFDVPAGAPGFGAEQVRAALEA